MGRRVRIAGLAAAALALAVPAEALAEEVPRGLTLRYSVRHDAFRGRITKPNGGPAHCFVHQQVIVYKRRSGEDLVLGSDLTNARRRYSVPYPRRSGRYYAKAPRSRAGDDTCLAVRTKTLTVL